LCSAQALTAYEQLRSEEDEEEGRLGFAKSTLADDIGNKFDDHLGLVKRIRDRCRQQSDIVRRVMHRETIYQGQPLQPSSFNVTVIVCPYHYFHS